MQKLPCKYASPIKFIDELAIIELNQKFGLVNKSGTIIVPCIYTRVNKFSENFSAVSLNGKWGFIDRWGKVRIPIEYYMVGNFKEGEALVRKTKDSELMFMDQNGKLY